MAQTRSTGQQTEADGPPAPPSVAAWVGLSTQKTRGHGAEGTDLFYLSGVESKSSPRASGFCIFTKKVQKK